MNAINFIQQHGVDKAREVVEGAPDGATHYRVFSCSTGYTKNISISECYIWYRSAWQECEWPSKIFTSSNLQTIAELKQIVESVDLVKEHYILDKAIEYANSPYTAPEIKVCLLDAIADYKSIYSDNEMGDDSHIENHISNNCEVIENE